MVPFSISSRILVSESIILINVVLIFTAEKRVKGVFAELVRNLCVASAPHVLSGELSLLVINCWQSKHETVTNADFFSTSNQRKHKAGSVED